MYFKEDSSGSETDAPHYPLDLRLAEARLQLEERLAAELRRNESEKRIAQLASDELRIKTLNDLNLRRSPDDRKKDPVQFVLGGDNVNWTGEDLPRPIHSQSNPQLRASMRSISGAGAPLPPPRRPMSSGQIVRSRSTDIVSHDDPRPPPRNPFTKQRALQEEGNETPTSTSITPPEEESTDSSLVEDDSVPKPRKRRINLPFGKKSKTPA